jgi:Family of unknown function (DUF6158)
MTDGVRHGEFSPSNPGTPVHPRPDRPAGGWDGDHARHATATDLDAERGIDPAELGDEDLFRELGSLHRTRLDTLRHGPDPALATHLRRTAELETEYLTRYPGREVDPSRLTQDG